MLMPILYIPIATFCICVLVFIAYLLIQKNKFNNSIYSVISENGFLKTYFDKGLLGEYYTVRELEKIEGKNKIIVNTYIPKNDGTTTEIDIILINLYGIFVIENKNYSGWIYGNENDYNWTQTLKGQKNKFYNPVLQNENHIKELKSYLKLKDNICKSIIVFSEHCELKKVSVSNTPVIKRKRLIKTIEEYKSPILNENEIMYYYSAIKFCANQSEDIKIKHIESIKARR